MFLNCFDIPKIGGGTPTRKPEITSAQPIDEYTMPEAVMTLNDFFSTVILYFNIFAELRLEDKLVVLGHFLL